jgi:hypothetical protein
MAKDIEHDSPSFRRDNLSVAEKMYEEWAQGNGLDFARTPSFRESVLGQCKFSAISSATPLTLFPDTWSRLSPVSRCFISEWDAVAHDWLMVGADLYTAIRKSRIALPSAGDTESESESAPASAIR